MRIQTMNCFCDCGQNMGGWMVVEFLEQLRISIGAIEFSVYKRYNYNEFWEKRFLRFSMEKMFISLLTDSWFEYKALFNSLFISVLLFVNFKLFLSVIFGKYNFLYKLFPVIISATNRIYNIYDFYEWNLLSILEIFTYCIYVFELVALITQVLKIKFIYFQGS